MRLVEPRLHPARSRSSEPATAPGPISCRISAAAINLYYVETEAALADKVAAASSKARAGRETRFATERGKDGPYFNGDKLCLVDAAYAPVSAAL